jgi:hypothetical protein
MKRRCTPALVALFCVCATIGMVRSVALATPLADIPADHWAYQYIQSLAADGVIEGYPDGAFKGDRPMTRYEMAAVVARAVAKLQAGQVNGATLASKTDLEKLQKLVDALKDELDALGVRVTTLEDSLATLERRTKFAQSLSLHGIIGPNAVFGQTSTIPRTIVNGTGAEVTPYWSLAGLGGGAIPNGRSGGAIDPFVTAFLTTDDSNLPFTQSPSGIQIRQDDRFVLAYRIDENLTVSFPIHLLNFEYGGEYGQQAKFDIEPGVDVNVAKIGALSNVLFKFGEIDNMKSSRTGLAFRAPFGDASGYPYALGYENAFQPTQKGISVSGTVFGLTDFNASFTRVDQTLLDTQVASVLDAAGAQPSLAYLQPIVPQQFGYTSAGAAAATTDAFSAGSAPLAQVFLTKRAVLGSLYVSFYDGTAFGPTGAPLGTVAPGGPAVAPAFAYNDAYNAVVFSPALPPGSTVHLSYSGLGVTSNTNYQRYMINARLNQKIKGYPGGELGFTYNRIFDFDDLQTTADVTTAPAAPVQGYGAVSDTVFGVDFQLPIPFQIAGRGSYPLLFGEAATSTYTPDYRNVPTVSDSAGVIGAKVMVGQALLSFVYQSVGQNFLDGAPFRYYGNAPASFANYKGAFFPEFFGFGNALGINTQFDNQFSGTAAASTVSKNPNLTYLYPLFDPLRGTGPQYYQSFTPNTRGFTANANVPIRLGALTLATRLQFQHLEEIAANSLGNILYGPAYASSTRLKEDAYTVGGTFEVPAFGRRIAVGLSGTVEKLKRPDMTPYQYYPIDLSTGAFDATAVAAATAAFPAPGAGTYAQGSQVSFYPNYINLTHSVFNASAALPLTKDLGLNLTYNTQRYSGAYGTTLTQSISQRKDYYQGAVSYTIPKTNSSIDFQTRQYRYVDDVLPTYNFVQNRQDVNFVVRF